jgi:hypothetical protein
MIVGASGGGAHRRGDRPRRAGEGDRQGTSQGLRAVRPVVESGSVLFPLADAQGNPLPSGWTVQGAKFEVEWPKDKERCSLMYSHFGARRFARTGR